MNFDTVPAPALSLLLLTLTDPRQSGLRPKAPRRPPLPEPEKAEQKATGMESNRAEPTSPSTYLMNPKSSPSTFLSGVVAACFLSSCATNPLGADRFAAADTNNDDHLSRKEASDAAIRGIMKDFDGNRDGRLTYAEWEKSDPAADPDLFARRDTDNDGFVTLAEAQASADRQQFLSPFIRKADLDGDGLVSRSEAAEYAARNAATKN